VNGDYSYTYDIELTSGNTLEGPNRSPLQSYPSSLTILDFGMVSETPTLTDNSVGLRGADRTTPGEWTVSTQATGAGTLPHSFYYAGDFYLQGSVGGISESASDSSDLSNITLEYTGPFLALNQTMSGSLIQLHILSTLEPGSELIQSLSRDGDALGAQEVDSFTVPTRNVTNSFSPEPASFSLLGVSGAFLLLRRKRLNK
jgi:hypothetical protein